MPRGDGTGPQGQGPRTGKGQGRCNSKDTPAAPRDRRGEGTGRGGGRGQGKGQSGGRGRGYGRGYGWYPRAGYPAFPVESPDEINMLKAQADYLKNSLDAVNQRINNLEKESSE